MKVIALKDGFYAGSLRQRGEQFDVADGAKASWFAPVESQAAKADAKAKAKEESKAKAKDEPKALSQVAAGGKSFNDVHAGDGIA